MKKVLIVQRAFPRGGGTTVAVWLIEALKKDYLASLLTWQLPDFEDINRFYGTSLKSSDLTVHHVNPLVRALMGIVPDIGDFHKTNYLMRICKKFSKEYDIIVGTDNEIDFGCKGIQYFHFPLMHEKKRPDMDVPWYKKLVGLFKGIYRPWMLISGFSFNRMINNLTLVNSEWTGDQTKEFYGMDTITVYPPVPGDFRDMTWKEKESGFVCIGRFHPDKRFEEIIAILTKVKTKFPEIHLHIIGLRQDYPGGHDYYQRLKALVQANDSWVFLHENLSRAELLEIVAKHRYGIHGHEEEHFGIAVAEMVRADCIVFVPNGGGQVEIVGGDERLVYESDEEAVEKIIRVMSNPGEQISVRSHLNSRREVFSTEKFMSQIQEIVRQFCNSHSSQKS